MVVVDVVVSVPEHCVTTEQDVEHVWVVVVASTESAHVTKQVENVGCEQELEGVDKDSEDDVVEEWAFVRLSDPVIDRGSAIPDRFGGGTGATTGTGGHSQPPLSGLWHFKVRRHLIRSTANSAIPPRPTGLHKGPMQSQVQKGNSTRTPLPRYSVLVDSVAVHMMSVVPETPSVRVTIS